MKFLFIVICWFSVLVRFYLPIWSFMNNIKYTEMATRFIAIDLLPSIYFSPFTKSRLAILHLFIYLLHRRLLMISILCVIWIPFLWVDICCLSVVWTCRPFTLRRMTHHLQQHIHSFEMKVILLLFAVAVAVFFSNVKTAWWNYTLIAIS